MKRLGGSNIEEMKEYAISTREPLLYFHLYLGS